ncbi:hypothetical protein RSOL_362050, partial [Rhizoctonia solani AG-3 Rhs1AP]
MTVLAAPKRKLAIKVAEARSSREGDLVLHWTGMTPGAQNRSFGPIQSTASQMEVMKIEDPVVDIIMRPVSGDGGEACQSGDERLKCRKEMPVEVSCIAKDWYQL